jgi:hypothetical protein
LANLEDCLQASRKLQKVPLSVPQRNTRSVNILSNSARESLQASEIEIQSQDVEVWIMIMLYL